MNKQKKQLASRSKSFSYAPICSREKYQLTSYHKLDICRITNQVVLFRLTAPSVYVPVWGMVHFIVLRVGDKWVWPTHIWDSAVGAWDEDFMYNPALYGVKHEPVAPPTPGAGEDRYDQNLQWSSHEGCFDLRKVVV